jgi:ATP-dependent Lon protease
MNEIFDGLLTDMPNFKDVIEHLREQTALRNRSTEPIMGSQPILLISEPGMGKSYFAERLANELSLEFYAVDMATITASFELTGGSSQWAESKPGRIYSNLISGSTLNPLILLDEVEKAPKGQYPVHGALFRILNPMQSNRYIDESVQPLAINASRIMYVLTANSLEDVHQAIIDRCLVFNIESPTKIQSANVAKSIWKSIRQSETWAATFDEQLSNDVLSILSKHTPRSMRKCLENAMATCAIRGGGSEILGSDIPDQKKVVARRMGF